MSKTNAIITVAVSRDTAERRHEPKRFSGDVSTQVLQESDGIRVQAVFFERGARTRPHIHVNEQLLFCVEGEGVVSALRGESGAPARIRIRQSDAVRIRKNTWHWHGATQTAAMTHVSVLLDDENDQWDGLEANDWGDVDWDTVV